LTRTRAKPVVPLLNRPFLAYQVALLHEHGIDDVILSCSYRVEDIRAAMAASMPAARVRYTVEAQPLGTGGGVRYAVSADRGTVWVLNGDILTDADLSGLRRFHEARASCVTILLTRVSDPRPYGLVETDAEGRVLAFREKPAPGEPITTNTVNAGIYLLDAELLRRIPAGRPVSIEREFFPGLIADGIPCFAWCPPAYWRDIGNPEAYRAAQMDLLDGRVRTPLAPPGRARGAGVWIADDVELGEGVLVPPVVIAEGVRVAAEARVGPHAVLGPGCRIGPRARVREAVLWEGVEVGGEASVVRSVIGAEARIGAGAALGAGTVLDAGAVVPDRARLGVLD
jgi:NDP-sugar pyrophosphorylase family protein